MKNRLAILLIPLFLFSTVGFSMTSLYCQGNFRVIAFSVHPCCDDVNTGGCCKTESLFLKVVASFIKGGDEPLAKAIGLEKSIFQYLLVPGGPMRHFSATLDVKNHWQKRCFSSLSIRILFCSFLI